ncbi:MAG: class C sortase [Propionibacteriaceae bacterium]|nr:class C sortase [Propionibacteriaceae bacterium]
MASHAATQRPTSAWRFSWASLVPAIIASIGMAVLTYPSIASWISQYNQSQIVTGYEDSVTAANPPPAEQLAQARAYNDALNAGAVLEADTNIPTGAGAIADDSLDYDSILRATSDGLMARLKIPSIDLDLPVYHGTADATLLMGIGHLEGTSLPVGGASTHAVLTGHRGLAQAEMFTHLDRVAVGDTFTVEVFGEVLAYQVVETQVVAPSDTEPLKVAEGRDLITLVTCTPLGINTHRILVIGERILPTPTGVLDAAGQAPELPRFPWWAVGLAAGTSLLGLYIWWSGYPVKRRDPTGRT